MAKDITSMAKYIPMVAALAAFYQVYQDRGVQGILDDVMAIAKNPMGITSKLAEIIVPLALVTVAPKVIRHYAPGGSIVKYALIGIVTYAGITQLAGAIRQGAGRAGRGGYIVATGGARRVF